LGVAYTNLRVYGIANDVDYQPTVTNLLWKLGGEAFRKYFRKNSSTILTLKKN